MEDRFVKYKFPDRYKFMEEFPVTSSGKISKLMLQELMDENVRIGN